MSKTYEVTMTSDRVVVYVRSGLGLNTYQVRCDLTPEQAREFAQDLIEHARDVEDIGKDALEQMA